MSTSDKKSSTSSTTGKQSRGPERVSEIGKRLFEHGADESGQAIKTLSAHEQQATTEQSSSSTLSQDEETERLIDYLFVCFSGHYGPVWTNRFKDARTLEVTRNEWKRRLTGFTVEQFREGWNRCPTLYRTFPPNPSEFRQMVIPSPAYAPEQHTLPQIAPPKLARLEALQKALMAQTNNPAMLRLAKKMQGSIDKEREKDDGT